MKDKNEFHSEKTLTVQDIEKTVDSIVPLALQESWDNSGLLIGFRKSPVKKLLTCLEINEQVLEEALEKNIDMIITHHPLIFQGMKSVQDSNYNGKLIMELIKNNISVYSSHTPFDKVPGGNNDVIVQHLELTSVKNLRGNDVSSSEIMIQNMDEADIGRVGKLKSPMTYMQVIDFVSDRLNINMHQLRAVGNLDREIKKVGICVGAGADLIGMAALQGCELFITGDVKYHQAQAVLEQDMCLLDAGHYGTEKFFASTMKAKLQKELSDRVQILESCIDLNPFKVL